MLHQLKRRLYFVVASYFAFWARFVLWRWRPRIVVITGSSGKTTLLHMVEAQLGSKAVYSHKANSAIGIPFHILGLHSNVPSKHAWLKYVIMAPFLIFRKVPKSKLYIVEADCDRPHEGAFTSRLLKPEAVLWVSVSRTHSMNFDKLVKSGQFQSHEQAIAHEFGNFIAAATKLVIADTDYEAIENELTRVKHGVNVHTASLLAVDGYELKTTSTKFKLEGHDITLPGIHPKSAGVSLQMVLGLMTYLNYDIDSDFKDFVMPPGRNNLLVGKNDVTIIDSTYNNGLGATTVMLDLFSHYPAKHKWLVMSDILEQGSVEQEEHEKLAMLLAKADVERVILLGKRTKSYSLPVLQRDAPKLYVESFEGPKEVLDYLKANLKGGETILFKGALGSEGVIEQLLANPDDAKLLVRRDASWVKRRQAWGLPK